MEPGFAKSAVGMLRLLEVDASFGSTALKRMFSRSEVGSCSDTFSVLLLLIAPPMTKISLVFPVEATYRPYPFDGSEEE
jgi:hypothetical protein